MFIKIRLIKIEPIINPILMKLKTKENVQHHEIINKNEFRIVGMSRSGNHPIINWITQQIQGRFCFLNCAEPKTNPFYTARPLDQEKVYRVNYEDFDLKSEKRGNFSQKDYLIHSYEDCFLGMLNSRIFEEQHDAFVGPSHRRVDILILRDPFNLFASRKKSGLFDRQKELSSKPVSPLTAVRIWKQHAKEAIGERQYLRHDRLFINYNWWACDSAYRKDIATALGINFTDLGIQDVSNCAGGSSFDGLKFANSANNMKVLERWKHFIHDQEYKKIFDNEIISLSNKIFGHIPDERLLSA